MYGGKFDSELMSIRTVASSQLDSKACRGDVYMLATLIPTSVR